MLWSSLSGSLKETFLSFQENSRESSGRFWKLISFPTFSVQTSSSGHHHCPWPHQQVEFPWASILLGAKAVEYEWDLCDCREDSYWWEIHLLMATFFPRPGSLEFFMAGKNISLCNERKWASCTSKVPLPAGDEELEGFCSVSKWGWATDPCCSRINICFIYLEINRKFQQLPSPRSTAEGYG